LDRTLLIVKPDAVERNLIGKILARCEENGFRIRAARMVTLAPGEARKFYAVHEGKPFLDDLVAYMSSGPCVPVVLEAKEAVPALRKLVGATNPKDAAPGTIRKDFAVSLQANSVHASDAPENARTEIGFFFPGEA
jgi:nucleoside-diphosphate kinase